MKKKVLRERRKPVEVKPVEIKETKPRGRKKKEVK
jgi:hypothetical protein